MDGNGQRSEVTPDPLDAVLSASDSVAVLTRELRVRLLDISLSGCRLESSHRIEPGTCGVLRMNVDGAVFRDDVRVVRIQRVDGGARWTIGLEFLWTSQPGERSLRRAAATVSREVSVPVDLEFALRPM